MNSERQLFGGAITAQIPASFMDVSDIRHVPDNQEVFACIEKEQNVIIELLELVSEASFENCATFHFEQVASDNDAEDHSEVLSVMPLSSEDVPSLPADAQVSLLTGRQSVTKFNEQSFGARNLIQVFLAVLRLPSVKTDVVITYNIASVIGETSSSRPIAKEGNVQQGLDDFRKLLASFTIRDWSLFQ